MNIDEANAPYVYIEVHLLISLIVQYNTFQELPLNTTKKHHPDKKIWESWMDQFAEHGINNIRLRDKFRLDFTLDYTIVLELFQDDEFLAYIKNSRILSKENIFLAFLHKAKTGL